MIPRWRLGLQDSASRPFRAPDGLTWEVEVRSPGSTNAMVVFLHPDRAARRDRYAWWITTGEEARNVAGRLSAVAVLGALDERELGRLFRRAMPIDSQVPRFEPG